MIETSLVSWTALAALLVLASVAGVSLARTLPWADDVCKTGVPIMAGLVAGPFIAGLLSVAALGVLPNATHGVHLAAIFSGLVLIAVAAHAIHRRQKPRLVSVKSGPDWRVWPFAILLALWVIVLLINTVMLPLTQNDALEYVTVGRILYDVRDLGAYPAIHPESTPTGFYGPWTHPPLYVAMIYLTHAIQGHADAPGLMRMISPWFAVTTILLVYSIGAQASRLAGVLAALLFISPPLFFLGTDSALIDSLPIAGIALVFAVLLGVQGAAWRRGVFAGIALGFALWTHSQAILFFPLAVTVAFASLGLRRWREAFTLSVVMCVVSIAVAAWPYLRNLDIFGSLVSDTPLVFALPELQWRDYFAINRGIDSWPSKIQYGIFKGWFALEAYALIFWIAILGMALFLRSQRKGRWWTNLLHGPDGQQERVLTSAFALVLVYWAGVVVSALLGVDLMIRNERYWLVLAPFVALFGGWGAARVLDWLASGTRRRHHMLRYVAFGFGCLFLAVFAMQLSVLTKYRWERYNADSAAEQSGSPRDWVVSSAYAGGGGKINPESSSWISAEGIDVDERFVGFPNILAVHSLKQYAEPDALVLSLWPADMYYAKRQMLSYLDPRLIDFYAAPDVESAFARLMDLGVGYVHMPDYYLPPIYNSRLQDVLARPDLSELVFSAQAYQIYRLRKRENCRFAENSKSYELTPGVVPWTVRTRGVVGGRKALNSVALDEYRMNGNEISKPRRSSPFFQRDRSTLLLSGSIDPEQGIAGPGVVPIQGQTEYLVDISMKGYGLVRILIDFYDDKGHKMYSRTQRVGELVLSTSRDQQRFVRRLVSPPAARAVRVGVEHVGQSWLQMSQAKIVVAKEGGEYCAK